VSELCCWGDESDNYTQTTTAIRRPYITDGKESDSGPVKVKIEQDSIGDMKLHITNLLQGRTVMGAWNTGQADQPPPPPPNHSYLAHVFVFLLLLLVFTLLLLSRLSIFILAILSLLGLLFKCYPESQAYGVFMSM
jgi:hypothetical protein